MVSLRQRLLFAIGLLVAILLIGAAGYVIIEGWSAFDALYMTVISVTTVGYGEIHELSVRGRVFTIFLLLGGMGILAYGISTITAFLVEGHLSDFLRVRNMEKKIQRLKDHFVLCGFEGEGRYVLEEFIRTKTPHVVIAKDLTSLHAAFPDENLLYIEGDPTKEHILSLANVQTARGLVSALPTDSENLLVVLSAREMAPNLRIITCVFDRENEHKFRRVGANGTVMASFIGGLRMASEAIRPTVVSFLDTMLRETEQTFRVEEVTVPREGSDWAGKSLREINIPKRTGLVVVAVKSPRFPKYIYNPSGDFVIEGGDILIVIGSLDQVIAMKRTLGYELPEEEGAAEADRTPGGGMVQSP